MTGRERLRKQHARRLVAMFGPMLVGLVLVTGVALGEARFRRLHRRKSAGATVTAVLAGFAIMVVGITYSTTLVRCPWCRASLLGLVGRTQDLDRIRCCPYCGEAMDAEAPDLPKAVGSTNKEPRPKKLPGDDELA